ncbi:MAG: hypothetical protein ACLQMT_06780 [Candidatus Acidiferrales bacterium]
MGSIVVAQSSFLGDVVAVAGADVYPGETLRTNTDGLIRLKIRDNQLYLSGNTTATLSQAENGLHATLQAGTAGFSAVGPQIEVETPIATVRAAGNQRAFGQITLTGPNQMIVSAYEGSLALDGVEGSEHTINAGQSYQVSLVADDSSPQTPEGAGAQNPKPIQAYKTGKKKLIFTLLLLGSIGLGGFFIYHKFSVSCADPAC